MSGPPSRSRQRLALHHPPADLSGFPERTYRKGTALFRAHRAQLGAWWFASDMTGRFDLPPEVGGTCYLARSACTALLEALGPRIAAAAAIPIAEINARVVSTLSLPDTVRAADTAHTGAAAFGITREISASATYVRPQQWALSLRRAGFEAIAYEGRFDPGRRAECLALFSDRPGVAELRDDPDPVSAGRVAADCGLFAAPVPPRSALTVKRPPG